MNEERVLALSILDDPDAAALPSPDESGRLPALISGLSAVHRAHLTAALRSKYSRPVVVLCPDESGAAALARDVSSLTGEDCVLLTGRDYSLYNAEAASRGAEQRRINALAALMDGAPVCCASAEGLLQRAMPPELFRRAAFLCRRDRYA